ncbi:hypothetical protein [Streptomyces gibsoniae]|uniref:SdpI family protein n=1 Tax=Streptomyces gibsoniae TaxID=3075529 RepID=A0ABU2UAB7_9ACTN|nr:hypothetical protein [Streptomyces sp. DSM 41699]MDT0470174.1 hypothetical protein [Streptomyces sp. DSM 41699]
MADISFGIFAIVFMLGCSAVLVRVAWLHWTDSDRAPGLRTYRYSSNPSVIRGHERGIVPLAGWLTALSLAMPLVLSGVEPVVAAGGLLILGSFLLLAAHTTIAWFNWPKALVPPHRRQEAGSVVEWFRERRTQRRTTSKAAVRGDARRKRRRS